MEATAPINLANLIKYMWEEHKPDFEKRLNSWANALNCGKDVSALAKKEFHQWHPLRTYISVSKAKSDSRAIYSLRFYGQEVAQLIVKDKKVILQLKGHEEKNKKWFGVKTKDDDYTWRGKDAKAFRARFKEIARKPNELRVKSPEHRVESKFIAEMQKGADKFGVAGLQIQPVMIANKFPLQILLPISANTGVPKTGTGYIDILARRKTKDNKVRLSVWELKRPEEFKEATAQAYIYAFTLLQILRESKSKNEWYKLFGFKSAIPNKLVIEAVVAITSNQRKIYLEKKEALMHNAPSVIGNDRIELYVAYYREQDNSIKLEENPFVKKPCV